jgi:hypothetical protein
MSEARRVRCVGEGMRGRVVCADIVGAVRRLVEARATIGHVGGEAEGSVNPPSWRAASVACPQGVSESAAGGCGRSVCLRAGFSAVCDAVNCGERYKSRAGVTSAEG